MSHSAAFLFYHIGLLLIYQWFPVLCLYGISVCVRVCDSDSVRVHCAFSSFLFFLLVCFVLLWLVSLFWLPVCFLIGGKERKGVDLDG